jgi:hypothetical protein
VATSQGLMVIGKADPDEEVLRAVVDSAFAGLGQGSLSRAAAGRPLFLLDR